MNELLLKLLGVRADETGSVVSASFEVHPVAGWTLFLVLAAAVVAITVVSYRRRDVEMLPGRRLVLTALRILALLGIAAVLLRPALGLNVEGLIRQSLILLFDQSASLALRDPRTDRADQVRMGITLGELEADGGLEQRPAQVSGLPPTRLDLLKAIVTNQELALVERFSSRFDLKAASFAGGLHSLAEALHDGTTNAAGVRGISAERLAAALTAEGRQSAPGNAVRDVLHRERGNPLAGMVLFTDGIRNAGMDLREAATLAREAEVPLHIVALGTTLPRDLLVVDVSLPEVAFVRDEVPVTVRLQARGMAGQLTTVSLSLDGSPIQEHSVALERDGESVISFQFTPEQVGDFEVSVHAPPRPDEILAENNSLSKRLRVVDDRIRVLLLEQSPRWEFRYLQALLLRDRRVHLKCVLFDGDPAIARGSDSPYLESFPARREDLFAYDLIVFGDVDPRNFTPSQLEILAEFVARGGGSVLMLAGRRFTPWAYHDTALERMLPVEFDRLPPDDSATAVRDRPLKLTLTPEGRSSSILRMAENPEEHLRRWEELPPVYWIAPVKRAKPAATVLVESPSGEMQIPVVAMQQYGVGQSMFVGTDNTWRWRRNDGESFHVAFWGRVVQRLAIHHLLSGSRRTQLALDRSQVLPGERVGISARLFTSAFEPLTEPSVRAWIQSATPDAASSPERELFLRAVPDQPGLFQGELIAPDPGRYRLRVGEDAPAAVDFTVEDRVVEAGETAMQEAVLREVATLSGGSFSREEDLHRLPELVQSQSQRIQSRVSLEFWSSPLFYLVILALLTTEWALRKWWQLK